MSYRTETIATILPKLKPADIARVACDECQATVRHVDRCAEIE
jgi:hypothetical protein